MEMETPQPIRQLAEGEELECTARLSGNSSSIIALLKKVVRNWWSGVSINNKSQLVFKPIGIYCLVVFSDLRTIKPAQLLRQLLF